MGAVLLVISVTAVALAWKAEQRVSSLEQELVRRQQESAKQAVEAQMLAKQASEGMGAAAAKVALLEARVAEVALQRTQLEDLIQSLSRSRDEIGTLAASLSRGSLLSAGVAIWAKPAPGSLGSNTSFTRGSRWCIAACAAISDSSTSRGCEVV